MKKLALGLAAVAVLALCGVGLGEDTTHSIPRSDDQVVIPILTNQSTSMTRANGVVVTRHRGYPYKSLLCWGTGHQQDYAGGVMSFQNFSGSFHVEGSHDGTTYVPILVNSGNLRSGVSQITGDYAYLRFHYRKNGALAADSVSNGTAVLILTGEKHGN